MVSVRRPDKDFAAFPTYPVTLPLKGASEEVNVFSERVSQKAVPGLPNFDLNRVVRPSPSIKVLAWTH